MIPLAVYAFIGALWWGYLVDKLRDRRRRLGPWYRELAVVACALVLWPVQVGAGVVYGVWPWAEGWRGKR